MANCWLYIYENRELNSIYVGIADNMARVYEKHNDAADKLREDSGTVILQTVEPFTSRRDARKAEAIAIYVASLAGIKWCASDEASAFVTTNIAGTHSTTELGPAIFTRDGTVDVEILEGTVIVPISADTLGDRPAPFGGHGGAFFAERARKYWSITPAKRSRITRLIAVLKGRYIILGDWDVDPDGDWTAKESPLQISVPLLEAERDDPRGIKGKTLTGHRPNSGVGYSLDLRG